MKSHIISYYNYMDMPFEEVTETVEKEDMDSELSTDIETVLLMHKGYTEVTKVEKNDIVTLSLKSELPKFNKENLGVNAGMGMFSQELEEALIGHSTGDSFTAEVQGKPVEVKIVGCKRLTVPELTDEFVKSLSIDAITTVDDYKKHLTEKKLEFYHEGYTEMYALQLFSETCEKCEWDIDPEEKEEIYRMWSKKQKEDRDFHGVGILENYEGEQEAMEREEAFFVMRIFMVYSFMIGADYRNLEISIENAEEMEKIKKTVMEPIENYLKDKVHIILAD